MYVNPATVVLFIIFFLLIQQVLFFLLLLIVVSPPDKHLVQESYDCYYVIRDVIPIRVIMVTSVILVSLGSFCYYAYVCF
jgi:hypothetical protein